MYSCNFGILIIMKHKLQGFTPTPINKALRKSLKEKKPTQKFQKRFLLVSGFTIVELMVVVTIIAILLVLVLTSISQNKMKSRDNVRISHLNTVRLALEEYRNACGEFPASLQPTANNGKNGSNCSYQFSDFLRVLPELPTREGSSLLIGTPAVPISSTYNGYFYSGLSTSVNGPCYNYHIGVELEFSEENGENQSHYLFEDHDYIKNENPYTVQCKNSAIDFGGNDADNGDTRGLYDFRSAQLES